MKPLYTPKPQRVNIETVKRVETRINTSSEESKKILKKVLKENSKDIRRNLNKKNKPDEILTANGSHKAVGVMTGALTISDKAGADSKRKYRFKIKKSGITVEANLFLGVRVLAEKKPGEIINIIHNYIVYPKYTKKGVFYVDIIAFDDNKNSELFKNFDDGEFLLIGVWKNYNTLLVQQSVDVISKWKTKKPLKPKLFKFSLFIINNDPSWLEPKPIEGYVYKIKAKLSREFKLVMLEMSDFACPLVEHKKLIKSNNQKKKMI